MILRHATRNDIAHWFGGGVPATMRALVVEHEGQVIGVAGLARMADHWQAFSAFNEALRGHRFTMGKVALRFAALLEAAPGAVFACANKNEPTAPALLARLGFVEQPNGTWRYG